MKHFCEICNEEISSDLARKGEVYIARKIDSEYIYRHIKCNSEILARKNLTAWHPQPISIDHSEFDERIWGHVEDYIGGKYQKNMK